MIENSKDIKVKVTYRFVTGETVEITADVLVTCESISTEQASEILKLVKEFDERDAKSERRETRRHISLSEFTGALKPSRHHIPSPSHDDRIISQESLYRLLEVIGGELTATQYRRLLLRVLDGMTYAEIAEREKVHLSTVADSVEHALKKIKKFFQK